LTEQAGDRANVAVVQRFYEGYAGQDMEKIREVLAEDVTWLIPGHHPLAGLKRGADEIVAFFNQLAKANFQAEVISLSASEDWVVDVHRGWGEYGEATLDMNWVLAYRIGTARSPRCRTSRPTSTPPTSSSGESGVIASSPCRTAWPTPRNDYQPADAAPLA